MSVPLIATSADGARVSLSTPTAMPLASAFLWNRRMMVQINCRGYATAQFMQPEPAKYAHAPNLEARTFMQPEQPYYAHHPGRFFYIKDEDSGTLFSVPYEPVRAAAEVFEFIAEPGRIGWRVQQDGLLVEASMQLAPEDVVELWSLRVRNVSGRVRRISVYPYFPVGYMSWMNQSASYRAALGGIVCASVTPYQRVEDYFKNRDFKDLTFLLHERAPDSWETRQAAFEGEGGLHAPSALQAPLLAAGEAHYEMPTTALQYRLEMAEGTDEHFRFLFGPAHDEAEIAALRARHLSADGFAAADAAYAHYLAQGRGCLRIETPEPALDEFINHWLPRQVYYHGDANRLTTDPQTRNYLQDHMGMAYVQPQSTRYAILRALSQQEASGAMPDGILLAEGAELKYINQIPHTDHCVWLPVCLQPYLDETGDSALLDEPVTGSDGTTATVFERISAAMRWLLTARDERGLSFIAQGDWCDPMNMVGYRGRGVSGWLTLATAHALTLWAGICERHGRADAAAEFRAGATHANAAVNTHLWDGDWYARGITDDDIVFGVARDAEGRIYLNPQSWAMLSGAAGPERQTRLIAAVEAQLETPYGVTMLAPAYTGMREDVGRLTQKFPGSAENGSVYNHAAAFYIHSLYHVGDGDRAYRLLRQMLPGPDPQDYLRRGQLPVFVPNYYRGAWYQYPDSAGRSSQLFNTGTAAWVYRCAIEGLFGLRGDGDVLRIAPQLPSHWPHARAQRRFRGAEFDVEFRREADCEEIAVSVDGVLMAEAAIGAIEAGRHYRVQVTLPLSVQSSTLVAAFATVSGARQ
ncbi:NdvB protein [Pseudoxanthomonas sp. UTMC 1351]|uniref:GH36-type glycosyl hydrolase domain-containing protein n=1 Tax=Pseudoxanthomonas sp. UTMC 1351 TaxID=2695853 RepID=UPI0034CD53A5